MNLAVDPGREAPRKCFIIALHNVPLVTTRHGPSTHTCTGTPQHMVFVYRNERGNTLFPLLTGICCHKGQSSKFKEQEVTQLHHLVDIYSKYLAANHNSLYVLQSRPAYSSLVRIVLMYCFISLMKVYILSYNYDVSTLFKLIVGSLYGKVYRKKAIVSPD